MNIPAKDLTKQAPSSPRTRVGGYVILSRMADKGRATLNGNVGEYHFNCPLDNFLFGFKDVKGDDVKALLASGASDSDVATWLGSHGTPKTTDEIKVWSDSVEATKPYDMSDKRDWFVGECAKVGIDPKTSTLFDFLETDDKQSFKA